MNKTFPLSVVLTAYHNRMMATFPELRELLNYMTGQDVPLWDIPRARVMCRDALQRKYTWLAKMEPGPETRKDTASRFVRTVARKIGYSELEVPKLKRGAYRPLTAVKALR
jgi:hypothetical protein